MAAKNTRLVQVELLKDDSLAYLALRLSDLEEWTEEEADVFAYAKAVDDWELVSRVLCRKAERCLSRIGLTEAEVGSMLAQSGAPTPSATALHEIARECTWCAAALKLESERNKTTPAIQKARKAVMTLRRVLPEIIDRAEFAEKGEQAHLPTKKQLIQLNRAAGYVKFEKREQSFRWHPFATILAIKYIECIDATAGYSADGPLVRFIQLVLRRCGVKKASRAAIEHVLYRAPLVRRFALIHREFLRRGLTAPRH